MTAVTATGGPTVYSLPARRRWTTSEFVVANAIQISSRHPRFSPLQAILVPRPNAGDVMCEPDRLACAWGSRWLR